MCEITTSPQISLKCHNSWCKYKSKLHLDVQFSKRTINILTKFHLLFSDDTDESRGGFVLKARSEAPTRRRSLSERSLAVKRTILSGLRIKKQHSTGDIHQRVTSGSLRSSGSTISCTSDESEHRQGREHLIVPQVRLLLLLNNFANTASICKITSLKRKRCIPPMRGNKPRPQRTRFACAIMFFCAKRADC
ncbi:unnamed protein product [Gongylonema pulchrum]|uniref:Uncharacterized protein n=1 Tax=Gongylonema pulchrum TaxID=637853 RepID=A0A183EMR0_9BILA|nr:unnamed protein product [Gongylonema pulchrum]